MKVGVVLLMAGKAMRFGGDKTGLLVNKKPVWRYSYDVFASMKEVSHIVVVSSKPVSLPKVKRPLLKTAKGGKYRQDSVFNGLNALEDAEVDYVLIHDAARPVINKALVKRVLSCARRNKACVPAVEVSSTLKEVKGGKVIKTLDRDSIRLIQTPQCFDFNLLLPAYKRALKSKQVFTDDAGIWEKYVGAVYIAAGLRENIKLTYPQDLIYVKQALKIMKNSRS